MQCRTQTVVAATINTKQEYSQTHSGGFATVKHVQHVSASFRKRKLLDKAETKSFDIVLGEKLFCFENNQFKHEENRGEYERKIQPGDVCVAPQASLSNS